MRQASSKKALPCPSTAIKIFGDAWTLFIIDSLGKTERRFSELERVIPSICPVTLANRLKKLEHLGFIQREEGTLDKLSVTYSLTKKGSGMLPIIRKMQSYAETYLS